MSLVAKLQLQKAEDDHPQLNFHVWKAVSESFETKVILFRLLSHIKSIMDYKKRMKDDERTYIYIYI